MGGYYKYVFFVGVSDFDFECFVVCVVERLNKGVYFGVELVLGLFNNKVYRGFVVGFVKGMVVVIVVGNVVEVL